MKIEVAVGEADGDGGGNVALGAAVATWTAGDAGAGVGDMGRDVGVQAVSGVLILCQSAVGDGVASGRPILQPASSRRMSESNNRGHTFVTTPLTPTPARQSCVLQLKM